MDTAEDIFSAIQAYKKAISIENFCGLILESGKNIKAKFRKEGISISRCVNFGGKTTDIMTENEYWLDDNYEDFMAIVH
jgi:hypothetical protein